MGEAEERILEMLQDGIITAEEASNLLAALQPDDQIDIVAGDAVITKGAPDENGPAGDQPVLPPDLVRFRHFWRFPFFVALAGLLLAATGLFLLYQAENVALLGFMCLWSLFLFAFLVTALTLWVRQAPWVHIRIQEKQGRRIAISVPMPMRLMGWAMRIGRRFVSQDQAMHLETAASLMQAMREDPDGQPLFIDVNDEDGDKVQVYIG